MGATVGEMKMLVGIDISPATNSLTALGSAANSTTAQMDKSFKSVNNSVSSLNHNVRNTFLAFGAAYGAVTAIKAVVTAASDLNESLTLSQQVFGDYAKDFDKFAITAADKMGLARQEVLQTGSVFGLFGQNIGMTNDQMNKFSQDLIRLSADMASAINTSVPMALTALNAALRGEQRPIRQYGVFLDDLTLRQEAFSLGIYRGVGVLNQQQRALASYSQILKQTSTIQGDFERTKDYPANASRRLIGEIGNLAANLGGQLMPALQQFLTISRDAISFLNDNIKPVMTITKIAAAFWLANKAAQALSATMTRMSTTGLAGAAGSAAGTLTRASKASMARAATPMGSWATDGAAVGPKWSQRASAEAGIIQPKTVDFRKLANTNPIVYESGAIGKTPLRPYGGVPGMPSFTAGASPALTRNIEAMNNTIKGDLLKTAREGNSIMNKAANGMNRVGGLLGKMGGVTTGITKPGGGSYSLRDLGGGLKNGLKGAGSGIAGTLGPAVPFLAAMGVAEFGRNAWNTHNAMNAKYTADATDPSVNVDYYKGQALRDMAKNASGSDWSDPRNLVMPTGALASNILNMSDWGNQRQVEIWGGTSGFLSTMTSGMSDDFTGLSNVQQGAENLAAADAQLNSAKMQKKAAEEFARGVTQWVDEGKLDIEAANKLIQDTVASGNFEAGQKGAEMGLLDEQNSGTDSIRAMFAQMVATKDTERKWHWEGSRKVFDDEGEKRTLNDELKTQRELTKKQNAFADSTAGITGISKDLMNVLMSDGGLMDEWLAMTEKERKKYSDRFGGSTEKLVKSAASVDVVYGKSSVIDNSLESVSQARIETAEMIAKEYEKLIDPQYAAVFERDKAALNAAENAREYFTGLAGKGDRMIPGIGNAGAKFIEKWFTNATKDLDPTVFLGNRPINAMPGMYIGGVDGKYIDKSGDIKMNKDTGLPLYYEDRQNLTGDNVNPATINILQMDVNASNPTEFAEEMASLNSSNQARGGK